MLILFHRYGGNPTDALTSGTYFEPGDLLVAKITPSFENGKQGIIENLPTPFGIATTEVIPIKAIEGVSDKYFLFYYLLRRDIRSALAGKMEGSTGRQRLSISTLASLEILLPSLREQQAIAQVLQVLQETAQIRQREIELEHERKAALMDYLFTCGIRNEPTKHSAIGDIPMSWRTERLGNICRIRYGLGQPPALDNDGIPMIRATDIKSGTIREKTIIRVKQEAIPESRNPFLNRGDIIVVRSGAYTGDVAMYDGRWEKAVAGYDLVVTPTKKGSSIQVLLPITFLVTLISAILEANVLARPSLI